MTVALSQLEQNGTQGCQSCQGYGIWAIGLPVPMGPIDAADGYPTQACPECGANANPVKVETTHETI